jgi:hypothetical protein
MGCVVSHRASLGLSCLLGQSRSAFRSPAGRLRRATTGADSAHCASQSKRRVGCCGSGAITALGRTSKTLLRGGIATTLAATAILATHGTATTCSEAIIFIQAESEIHVRIRIASYPERFLADFVWMWATFGNPTCKTPGLFF